MANLTYIPPLEKNLVELDDLPDISIGKAGWVGGTNVVLEQKEMASLLVTTYDAKLTSIFNSLEEILIEDPLPIDWKDLLDDLVIDPVPGLDLGSVPLPGDIVIPAFEGISYPDLGELQDAPVIDLDSIPVPDPVDVPDYIPPTIPTVGSLADVPTLDLNTIPAPTEKTLPGFDGLTFPTIGTLREVPDIDVNYTFPDAPAAVDPTLEHTLAAYTSDMWLDLFTEVDDMIVNGGTGLTEAEQTARHDLDAERKSQANEKAYLASQADLNSKALSFPSFVMTNLENQMAAEVLRQEHASSNEIYIADGELTQKNRQFAIGVGVDMEKILRGFWQVSEQMNFDFKKGVAEFILKKFSEENQAYIAQTQGITAKMNANVAAAEAIVKANQPVIDRFRIEMDGVLGEGSLVAKERDSIISAAGVEASIYKTKVDAAGVIASTTIAANDQVLSRYKTEMDGALGEGELQAKQRDSIINVARTEAEIYKATIEGKVAGADAVVAINNAIINKFKAEMDGALGEAELLAKARESIVNVANIEAQIYRSRVQAVADYYNAQTENHKAQLLRSNLLLDKAKAELDFILKTQIELSDQRQKILAELGRMFTQITSAALNTVSTAVNHSTNHSAGISSNFSTGRNKSETYHHGQSGSESRSIQQEGPDLTT